MRSLMKALYILLDTASDSGSSLSAEELEMQLDLCGNFLTEEETIFFTENSVLGASADTETWERVIFNRFRQYK